MAVITDFVCASIYAAACSTVFEKAASTVLFFKNLSDLIFNFNPVLIPDFSKAVNMLFVDQKKITRNKMAERCYYIHFFVLIENLPVLRRITKSTQISFITHIKLSSRLHTKKPISKCQKSYQEG